jgi:hypothetical protein
MVARYSVLNFPAAPWTAFFESLGVVGSPFAISRIVGLIPFKLRPVRWAIDQKSRLDSLKQVTCQPDTLWGD